MLLTVAISYDESEQSSVLEVASFVWGFHTRQLRFLHWTSATSSKWDRQPQRYLCCCSNHKCSHSCQTHTIQYLAVVEITGRYINRGTGYGFEVPCVSIFSRTETVHCKTLWWHCAAPRTMSCVKNWPNWTYPSLCNSFYANLSLFHSMENLLGLFHFIGIHYTGYRGSIIWRLNMYGVLWLLFGSQNNVLIREDSAIQGIRYENLHCSNKSNLIKLYYWYQNGYICHDNVLTDIVSVIPLTCLVCHPNIFCFLNVFEWL